MKRLILAGFVLGGLVGSVAVGIVMKPYCNECHCKQGGMCCCGGKCKPECDCGRHCDCKNETPAQINHRCKDCP